MKQKYFYLSWLFVFRAAYIYAFIAGIFVSLAVNLFTTALLTNDLSIAVWRVYGMAFSFFVSSIGAFGVSALLEVSRSDWEKDGAQSGLQEIYAVEKHLKWKVLFLLVGIIGFASAIIWV
jgi:hypothetical protein